ncbi:glycosyl transferase family 41-domain-containing protein [Lipomyces arxii]|uniref:glycosyl transferase family 41-domain-containing protein n=1 Tax=Lipomyces arxii TaxID=56418 RepID=UPI0034CEA8F7
MASQMHDGLFHQTPSRSTHMISSNSVPSKASFRQLLSFAHDRYASYPHVTSSEELLRVLRRLDDWSSKIIANGLHASENNDFSSNDYHTEVEQHHLQNQNQAQPYADATQASSVLEAWLLCGCISYSLGDMESAIEWNYRILRVDPGYVEAMSNLAAAMRMLRRNSEAESWWTRAVHLRPMYWDAADHLFSLLCSQHRYNDAANVLAYVEVSAISPSVPAADFARYLAIVHAKGTLLYALNNHVLAAAAFSRVLALTAGYGDHDWKSPDSKSTLARLIKQARISLESKKNGRLLLTPQEAQMCVSDVFDGDLPCLRNVRDAQYRQSISQTTANTLLTLAKIFQDALATGTNNPVPNMRNNDNPHQPGSKSANTHTLVEIMGHVLSSYDVLPLYYLSLALHPSPSTANNIGILLASLAGPLPSPGERSLALDYYRYGLSLDARHPHLYTNLGSLLKDQGRLAEAVTMYERAVECDPNFDIALANLANAVKDQGRVGEAIGYYRRAIQSNDRFDEAACGLANVLNSVCDWTGRGSSGVELRGVDNDGNICFNRSEGWISRILEIVDDQLKSALTWGNGVIASEYDNIVQQIIYSCGYSGVDDPRMQSWIAELDRAVASGVDEGAKLVELLEVAARRARWRWYTDKYVNGTFPKSGSNYPRPILPSSLTLPIAPTVLPFHTFTMPFDNLHVREICRRTGLRVSITAQRSPWLPQYVYPPPAPPSPSLKIGYVSSDFNNHPLSHLMQNVFGFHLESTGTATAVESFCYAITPSDGSAYRQKIEQEAHHFVDVSNWSTQAIVEKIVQDGIHILVNLNGFTRGARNEIFACRPAPLSIAFMGFAGSMGAEWSDYVLADRITIPKSTLRRYNSGHKDKILRHHDCENQDQWSYFEDVVFCRSSFFCCDQRQSAPDTAEFVNDADTRWHQELGRRQQMRLEHFPSLSPNTIIFANFNQLYKIDPAIFVTWLRILSRVPNSILWLLKFPDLGATNLQIFAKKWAGPSIASRIVFTDVANKELHLLRSRVPDLFLDTPECNAHTTATDVIWTGTPILTMPRHDHKMCSRIAASVVMSSSSDHELTSRLVTASEIEYEERAVELATSGVNGELLNMRKSLYLGRHDAAVFDTPKWTRDLERAYWLMWHRWVEDGGNVTIGKDKDYNLYI